MWNQVLIFFYRAKHMNNDRRILAWLAILVSLFCCTPLVCGAGFIALAGGVTYLNADGTWGNSDTALFVAILVVAVVAAAGGLLFAVWGVMSLLKRDSNSNPDILDHS